MRLSGVNDYKDALGEYLFSNMLIQQVNLLNVKHRHLISGTVLRMKCDADKWGRIGRWSIFLAASLGWFGLVWLPAKIVRPGWWREVFYILWFPYSRVVSDCPQRKVIFLYFTKLGVKYYGLSQNCLCGVVRCVLILTNNPIIKL